MGILLLFDNNIDNDEVEEDIVLNDDDDFLDYLEEVNDIKEYFQIIDEDISTEENLNDDQIINLVQNEDDEINKSDDDISDEEIPLISIKKGMEGLKTFISYFEQQNNSEFNLKDLNIFRKYLRIIKTKEFNSKNQSTLDGFFNN